MSDRDTKVAHLQGTDASTGEPPNKIAKLQDNALPGARLLRASHRPAYVIGTVSRTIAKPTLA